MSPSLKDAIKDLVRRHAIAPRRTEPEAAILRLARSLPDGSDDVRRPKDYDSLSVALSEALEQGQPLTGRQARDGAWCLWTTKVALAAQPRTLEPFLVQLRELRHKRASRALALSYLVSFHRDRPGLSGVAATLRDLVDVMGTPFDALHERLRLFDETEGPQLVGDIAWKRQVPPRRVLEDDGVKLEMVLAGGYVEPCARRVLQRAADDRRLQPQERLDFLTQIAVHGEPRRLNFPSHKDLFANALLLPYKNAPPEKRIQDRTLDLLISLAELGDPRTKSANWVNMPDASDVAKSWLTEQALRQFLDVVEEVNPNKNWHYRRTFWEAVHAEGLIREAWVVLDPQGEQEARRRFGGNARFGRFMPGGGVQAGHAVLLLRIGAGICAEWSFSGTCRFWEDAGLEGAPKLYGTLYDANLLKSGRHYAPVEEIKHNSHTGSNAWQHKAARRIHSMTGARLSPGAYMRRVSP